MSDSNNILKNNMHVQADAIANYARESQLETWLFEASAFLDTLLLLDACVD